MQNRISNRGSLDDRASCLHDAWGTRLETSAGEWKAVIDIFKKGKELVDPEFGGDTVVYKLRDSIPALRSEERRVGKECPV